jgi:hypothetical protein
LVYGNFAARNAVGFKELKIIFMTLTFSSGNESDSGPEKYFSLLRYDAV